MLWLCYFGAGTGSHDRDLNIEARVRCVKLTICSGNIVKVTLSNFEMTRRVAYGPMQWEQDGFPPGTYIISQGHGMIERGDPLLATRHPLLARLSEISGGGKMNRNRR